jgi:hypothetical protein
MSSNTGKIMLCEGQFGWDYLIVNLDNERETIVIQSDWYYPSAAIAFGWNGDDSDIGGAQEYLDDHINAVADDPGYFWQ